MEEFTYDVQLGTTGDITQRTWRNDFGDGYVQAGGTGINGRAESWSVTLVGRLTSGAELAKVRAFLDRHEGYRSFLWRSPSGVSGQWRSTGYVLNPRGAGVFTLTTTFEQSFRP